MFSTCSNFLNTNLRLRFIIAGLILAPVSGIVAQQRVGINVASPTEMLDVNGRLRIRYAGGQSAGTYFNNSTLANRSFAGILNNDYMGFWGVGSNWNLVMNTTNGNLGIGTTSPTTRLDVNGSLRIRENARAGAVMTAKDNNGNMGWVGPVHFMCMGTPGNADMQVTTNSINYTRMALAAPDMNLGNGWDPVNHVFVAPVAGIYHFSAHLQIKGSEQQMKVQLVRFRGNSWTILYHGDTFIVGNGKVNSTSRPYEVSTDVRLLAGDVVFMEFTRISTDYALTLSGARTHYYFSGQLVAPL